MSASRVLVDTAVFVAIESRGLDPSTLPADAAVSIVSYAELAAGVHAAEDLATRSRRLSSMATVAAMRPLPIDTRVAEEWASIRGALANSGRRININDIWIAATARAHRLAVLTEDVDFDVMAELADVEVIHL